jgi:hypothetical protein
LYLFFGFGSNNEVEFETDPLTGERIVPGRIPGQI